jgi:hypothetical protein
MRIAMQNASHNPLCNVDGSDKLEDEQCLYEGLELYDDELDTYDQADFGVLRYFALHVFLLGLTQRNGTGLEVRSLQEGEGFSAPT